MTSRLELPDAPSPGPITPFTISEGAIWMGALASVAFPLAGEFSRAFAFLQFLAVPSLVIAFGVAVVFRAWRTPRLLGALPLLALGVFFWARLTSGVPHYVHRDAEPIIAAILQYHDMHGTYPPGGLSFDDETPPELREVLGGNDVMQCIYSTDDDSFRVTCRGVMFNHCTYDSAENRWFVWD